VRAAHPTAQVTVWAEDEHRIGLLPVRHRVWAQRGKRPIAWVQRRYEWISVYAFVRPKTGQSWWAILPTVSIAAMNAALAAFAVDEGMDADHRAVLMVDGAGWHTSSKLVLPEGLDLIPLPPASPELQPVERVWSLLDEPVANRTFADLDALEETLVTRSQTLRGDRRTVKAHTKFHWWPRERRPKITQ
jgi:transposase